MHISDLLGHYNSSVTQSEPMTKTIGVEKLVSPLSEFSAGNVFEGTVSSVKGNQVVLSLANGSQVTARLATKISLEKGESMFFQVKSNSGKMVEIKPFTVAGSGANYTLLEALKAAGLPTDSTNLEMVKKMMEEQMSIDKNSLANMARLVTNHGDINVTTLVQLQKLGIPITSELASQFENYLSDNQAIGEVMDSFMEELPTMLGNENMSFEQIKDVSGEILNIVTEGLSEEAPRPQSVEGFGPIETELIGEEVPNTLGNVLSDKQILELNELIQRLLPSWSGDAETEMYAYDMETGQDVTVLADRNAFENININENGNIIEDSKLNESTGESAKINNNGNLEESAKINNNENLAESAQANENSKNVDGIQQNITGNQSVAENQNLNGQATNPLSNNSSANEYGFDINDEVIIEEANDMGYPKDASVVSVLKDVQTLILNSSDLDKKSVLNLFKNECFKELVKDALGQQWMIRPQDLLTKEDGAKAVNKLYEQIEKQLNKLERAASVSGQNSSTISSLATEIRSNIEFMNQINEAYTYVQIPLKMTGQSASGELYVYTNKRSLNDKDKELTAFLHLDMDNLGPTDVSVKMLGKEVTTNFYLEDDSAYDLIERYLPVLQKRLQDKGYNCKITVTNEQKHVNFVEDFMKRDMPSSGRLHRYSFDMRA